MLLRTAYAKMPVFKQKATSSAHLHFHSTGLILDGTCVDVCGHRSINLPAQGKYFNFLCTGHICNTLHPKLGAGLRCATSPHHKHWVLLGPIRRNMWLQGMLGTRRCGVPCSAELTARTKKPKGSLVLPHREQSQWPVDHVSFYRGSKQGTTK